MNYRKHIMTLAVIIDEPIERGIVSYNITLDHTQIPINIFVVIHPKSVISQETINTLSITENESSFDRENRPYTNRIINKWEQCQCQ